ncbi:MAG: hypothetical protein ABSH38_12400 [Verrucomicrobiota bacterium]
MSANEKSPEVSHTDVIPASFVSLAGSWCRDQSAILLGFVWAAYDQLIPDTSRIDSRDLERSITQLLEARIRRAMSGDEPFYIQHGPYERETMKPPPAQPPQYDLAFVLNANERVMWPLEAKVVEKPAAVVEYANEIQQQFLTCRYAPFCGEGAMLGYLLSGTSADTFNNIAVKISCKLENHPSFTTRSHKTSRHRRQVPVGKTYPPDFLCHHLILELLEVKRHRN